MLALPAESPETTAAPTVCSWPWCVIVPAGPGGLGVGRRGGLAVARNPTPSSCRREPSSGPRSRSSTARARRSATSITPPATTPATARVRRPPGNITRGTPRPTVPPRTPPRTTSTRSSSSEACCTEARLTSSGRASRATPIRLTSDPEVGTRRGGHRRLGAGCRLASPDRHRQDASPVGRDAGSHAGRQARTEEGFRAGRQGRDRHQPPRRLGHADAPAGYGAGQGRHADGHAQAGHARREAGRRSPLVAQRRQVGRIQRQGHALPRRRRQGAARLQGPAERQERAGPVRRGRSTRPREPSGRTGRTRRRSGFP